MMAHLSLLSNYLEVKMDRMELMLQKVELFFVTKNLSLNLKNLTGVVLMFRLTK